MCPCSCRGPVLVPVAPRVRRCAGRQKRYVGDGTSTRGSTRDRGWCIRRAYSGPTSHTALPVRCRHDRLRAPPVTADEIVRTLVGVLLLVAVATTVLLTARAASPWAPAAAILRGVVQLAAISLVLTGIIRSPLLIALALTVMFSVAATTAARRLGGLRTGLAPVAVTMAAGILVSGVVVFGSGAIAFSPRYVLAVGGIVIGNAMSIATMAGRRFRELVDDRWEEVEGWLALGATPRRSTVDLVRRAVSAALIPTVDQTKTTGLVTLPGAFVGAIFGGVSPLEAGRFQIVVLAAIMATGSVTAVLLTRWLAPVRTRPSLRER
ncbi:ABC transporter permease [Curtobacterium sp. ISL-83]|nr:ABC transporter permease [Curtobacterium sp. ISL-83]